MRRKNNSTTDILFSSLPITQYLKVTEIRKRVSTFKIQVHPFVAYYYPLPS